MKRIILAVLISLFLVGTASAWELQTLQVQYTASGSNQTMLQIGSEQYCHVMIAWLMNDSTTTSTTSMHWEGSASATNRIIPSMSMAAGEGAVLDLSKSGYFIIGEKGEGIEVDSSGSTTITAFIVYFLDNKKRDH